MLINANSGIIYPESGTNDDLSIDVANLASGGVLYGQNDNYVANNTQGITDSGTQQVKNSNVLLSNAGNTENIIFDGNKDTSSKQRHASIDQSIKSFNDKEINKKLKEYRKQIDKWKESKENDDLLNNFGLDMNGTRDSGNKRKIEKVTSESRKDRNPNTLDQVNFNKNIDKEKYYDNLENEKKLDFEPISFKKQKQRNQFQESNNGKDEAGKSDNHRNDNARPSGHKVDRSSKYGSKTQSKVGKNDGDKKRSSKAGKVVKNATKVSLKTSGSVTAKGLMVAWGLGSTIIKQDILFRLIIGFFVGIAFVSLAILGR